MAAKDLIFTILGIDKASDKFDRVGDAIERMVGRGTTGFGALAAGAAVSSVATAGALLGVSVAVAGAGAAILSHNQAVRDSFAGLSATVRAGLLEDAAPLEDTFVHAAEQIGAAYTELRPQLQTAFAAAAPQVDKLVDGITGLARTAMPGVVTAVRSAGPVFDGLRELLHSTGRGVGQFFEILATGAPAAGQGITSLGELAEQVLPDVARLIVDLTEVWAEHGDQATRVIAGLIDVATDLGESALPTVSDAMGVALDVLEGALQVIAPLADQLGPLIGLWLSLSTALRLVGGAQTAITGVTGAVSRLREGMSDAGGGAGMGRFTTGIRGALSLLGGPWGAALTAAGIALAVFGQRSQDSAAGQRSLASALRESGGQFDVAARSALANSEPYKKIAGDVEKAGLTHRQFIDAVAEGGPTLDALKQRLEAQARAGETVSTETGALVQSFTEQGQASQNLLLVTDGLRTMVVGATEDFRREQEAVGGAAASLLAATPGATALNEALLTLKTTTADTADRADALNDAWRRLFGVGITIEEATAEFEDGLHRLREQIDGVKHSSTNWQAELLTAYGTINTATEGGRALLGNLVEQGNAYRDLAITAHDTALQQGRSQQEATAAAVAAAEQRRAQFIAEMRQMGFTAAQAEVLATRYLGLPRDILTTIRADTSQASSVIRQLINVYDGSVITVRVKASGDVQALGARGTPVGLAARAGGGPVTRGQLYRVGEDGEELFVPAADGMIIPAEQTRRILAELRRPSTQPLLPVGSAAAASATTGAMTPSAVVKHYHLTVVQAGNDLVDLRAQFRAMELLEAP
jgi:hypothetical protein